MKLVSHRRFLTAALGASIILSSSALAFQRPTSEPENLQTTGTFALASGQWDVAIQDYEKAIALAPKDADLRVELGVVLTKTGRLPDSIAAFQDALHLAPHNLAAELGGWPRRIARCATGGERTTNSESRNSRAPQISGAASSAGRFRDPAANLRRSNWSSEGFTRAGSCERGDKDFLAGAYKAKGDLANALAELQKVLARDSKNVLAYFLRAEIYSDQNRDELALPDARKVVDLQPEKAPRPHFAREDSGEDTAGRLKGGSCKALLRSRRGARTGGSEHSPAPRQRIRRLISSCLGPIGVPGSRSRPRKQTRNLESSLAKGTRRQGK